MSLSSIFGTVKARLDEPSTHAGAAVVLTALGTLFPQYAAVCQGLALIFGGTAMVKADKK